MNLTLDDMRNILEIYGDVPAAPAGYEFTGELRKPASEDLWLGTRGLTGKGSWLFPRLILGKLSEPELTCTISTKDVYPKGYEIPEGYESLGFGLAHPEATHYLDAYGITSPVLYRHKAPYAARILLKKKA